MSKPRLHSCRVMWCTVLQHWTEWFVWKLATWRSGQHLIHLKSLNKQLDSTKTHTISSTWSVTALQWKENGINSWSMFSSKLFVQCLLVIVLPRLQLWYLYLLECPLLEASITVLYCITLAHQCIVVVPFCISLYVCYHMTWKIMVWSLPNKVCCFRWWLSEAD